MVQNLISAKYPKCMYFFSICHPDEFCLFHMCMLHHLSLVNFNIFEKKINFLSVFEKVVGYHDVLGYQLKIQSPVNPKLTELEPLKMRPVSLHF